MSRAMPPMPQNTQNTMNPGVLPPGTPTNAQPQHNKVAPNQPTPGHHTRVQALINTKMEKRCP